MELTRRRILQLAALASGLPPTGCGTGLSSIEIRGSDSEVNLVQRLAEVFMEREPTVSVAVTGGGSGAGIAALMDDTVTLANSSREMKAGEKLVAIRRGVHVVSTLFATDALTVIVHANNPIDELSVDDLCEIFAGRTTSFAALGGPASPVVAYGRQSSSGTYTFFRDFVVRGDFGRTVREMNGNGQIVEAVKGDPGGIGYVAVGYLQGGTDGVKALRVASPGGPAVSPLDKEAVLAGRYPIARPLYQLSNGRPAGALLRFLQFELGSHGERIIEEMGFYPLVYSWRSRNAHIEQQS